MDPLFGYLLLIEKLYIKKKKFSGAWNFGPNNQSNKKVLKLVNSMNRFFYQKVIIDIKPSKKFHEEKILKLNSIKSKKLINWKPKYNFIKAIKITCDWYNHFLNGNNMESFSKEQVIDYFKK